MTCPTCSSPRPEERRKLTEAQKRALPWSTTLCVDSYHNQVLDSEERERVLPSQS